MYAFFIIYFSTFANFVVSDTNFALAFDRFDHGLVDIGKLKQSRVSKVGYPIALACPPHEEYSKLEKKFNDDYSLTKSSLFVRKIYSKNNHPSIVNYKICHAPYSMSVIYNKKALELEFGNEIYFNFNDNDKFSASNHEEFDSVVHAFHLLHMSKSRVLRLDKNTKLGFIWIRSFRLNFIHNTKRLLQIIYLVSKSTDIGVQCDKYDIGNEYYEKIDVTSLYSKENQAKIFKNIEIPTSQSDDEYREAICPPDNQCLLKWSLIPANQFYYFSPAPVPLHCSDLTTIPIWSSTTKEILHKLDKYLYVLNQIADENIKVLSGVHGVLQMPTKKDSWTWKSKEKITLMGNGNFPVPNVIYKLVKYNLTIKKNIEVEENESNSSKIAVIIVIHNDPYFKEEDKICKDDKCADLGLSEIQYFKYADKVKKSKYIYCCLRDQNATEKLEMTFSDDGSLPLDLKVFPLYAEDDNGQIIQRTNVIKKIADKMKKLYGKEEVLVMSNQDGDATL